MPPVSAPRQWRSLDALADTPEFRAFLEKEFPAVMDLSGGPDRRRFLKLMAASFALAGLTGCDEREDKRNYEVPYVRNPERMQPSEPLYYASTALVDGFANGILVQTLNGRPLKVEGNPQHPWSRGGTDVFGQASVLGLYDPARSASVRRLDRVSNWQAFRGMATGQFAALRAQGGAGLRLLTGPLTSPLLLGQIAAMREAYPDMAWHSYGPVDRTALHEGAKRAFGRALDTRWRFSEARVIVSLDGDFLDPGPQQVGVAQDWIAARRASIAGGGLLTMHAAGPIPNLTSAKADDPVAASQPEVLALAQGLLADLSGPDAPPTAAADASPIVSWRARAAAALHGARGAGLVVAGTSQPAEVHELVHRLNAALGNAGKTVFYAEPVVPETQDLRSLVSAMQGGSVAALVMMEANPVYDAAGSLGFADAMRKVPLKIHAGTHVNETGLRADWHVPVTHPLESWGDARSFDGTIGLLQPTVAPLYTGRSPAQIISLLTDGQERQALDLLKQHYQGDQGDDVFEPQWQTILHDGFVANSASKPVETNLAAASPAPAAPSAAGLDVLFRPDPAVWDGMGSDNPWLQELPKPLTKMVWSNAVSISQALAAREGLAQGDLVRVEAGGRSVEGPVWVMPGQADQTIGVTLGYGRNVPDRIAYQVGYSAYELRDASAPWRLPGATLRNTGRKSKLVTTQDHNTMGGHDFVRIQEVGAAPVGETKSFTQPTLYPSKDGDGRAWGMVIDLDACIGCNACVTACQAENNIAVVGPEQVAMGREMHWLRIDRYYEGPPDAPATHFQPVPCMHCENAPCELGCPVEATIHDQEGLNLQVYNRCIGTRACQSYCPYKVRHFNFLDYAAKIAPSAALQRNPEVSIRARGVMEKCTYCVQRIVHARIQSAKAAGAPIPDGTVQTACQGACPTRAISFGDLNDKGAAVVAARHDPRNYALLGELNVRPRTTYLAKMAPRGDA